MKYLKRFSAAILFALLVTATTYAIAQARTGTETDSPAQPGQQQTNKCIGCHAEYNTTLMAGQHGHAYNDPAFQQMWADQGKPGACLVCHVTGYDPATGSWTQDGVSCDACHATPAAHLTSPSSNPVPVDRTSDLCGRCHTGDRFNVADWQTSTHFQRGMTCIVCHDPHNAILKTVPGQEELGPSALCINCHKEVAMAFPYSKHASSGISCVECHLLNFTTGTNNIHAIPDHSFTASIAVCSSCHADQMHSSAASTTPDTSNNPVTPTLPAETPAAEGVGSSPAPVSPLGFAGLAGLIGLAGGMVLQPWLEKAYRNMNKKEPKK
jgi:predicted CXXCH cytochrome family protein